MVERLIRHAGQLSALLGLEKDTVERLIRHAGQLSALLGLEKDMVERLIRHAGQLSALLGLETASKFIIPTVHEYERCLIWFVACLVHWCVI